MSEGKSLFDLYPNTPLYLPKTFQTDYVEIDETDRFLFKIEVITEAGRHKEIGLMFLTFDKFKEFADGMTAQYQEIERELNVEPNSDIETSESAQ